MWESYLFIVLVYPTNRLSLIIFLRMSSESTDEGEVPHYAYLVLRIFPTFPIEITFLCHHAETNDVFLPGGRVGLSPLSKSNRVEFFLV